MDEQKKTHIESLGGRLVLDSLDYDALCNIREAFKYKLGPSGYNPRYQLTIGNDLCLVSLDSCFDGHLIAHLYRDKKHVVLLEGEIGVPDPSLFFVKKKKGNLSAWRYIDMYNFPTDRGEKQPFRDKRDGLEKIANISLAVEQALLVEGVEKIYGTTHSSVAHLFEDMGYTITPSKTSSTPNQNTQKSEKYFDFSKQISQNKLILPRILKKN